MDITVLQEYFIIPVFVFCAVVGICIKHIKVWGDGINQFIPLIMAVVGVAVSIAINWGNVTPITWIAGAFTGWASTGCHQMLTKFMDIINKEDGNV